MLNKLKKLFKRYFVKEKITPIKTPVFEGYLLSGKTALIVGGSGGIGAGIAERFIANGCKVVIAGTNEEKLTKLCEKLGENCNYIIIDLTNIGLFNEKLTKVAEKLGKIDILVNSSGVHCTEKFGNVSEVEWDKVMDINLKGMYFMSQEVSSYMIKNGIKGHILNVSSASCNKPGWTPYEISKWGVKSLTLGFADKLAPYGIIVNAIAPGPVATAMLKKDDDSDLAWAGNPTGRMATTEEIANLAVVMVSDLGDLIVGDTYFVSGGSGTVCLNQ